MIGWGSWSQRAARVTPLANVNVPPHPGRIKFYLRMRNIPKSFYNSNNPETKKKSPGSIPLRAVWKPNTTHCLGLMDPARD